MFGAPLDEAFGKRKKKENNNHPNILAKYKLNNDIDNRIMQQMENKIVDRIDNKIIIEETNNLKENNKTNDEINQKLLNKLNDVLVRLNTLENNIQSIESKNEIANNTALTKYKSLNNNAPPSAYSQALNTQPPQPVRPPQENNSKQSNNFINKMLEIRNSNTNNSSNSSNTNNSINNSLTNDSFIEGFQNNNISYIGDQLNELILFGLMGLFILLLFDYIYKLGKKTY